MSILVPNSGLLKILKWITNYEATDGGTGPSGGNRVLKIYTNDFTPSATTTTGDLIESTDSGYAAITLTGTNWTISNVSGVDIATYPVQTFNFDAQTILYGYYITDQSDELLWIERFSDGPYNLTSGGANIDVAPKIKAFSS